MPEEVDCRVVEETGDRPGRVETPSGDIHFVNASGTLAQMGGQIGAKMSDLVADGPVPFYTTFLARTLEDSPLGRLSNLAGWATRKCATDRIIEGFDGEFRRAIEAFADAVGMASRSLLKAYAVPETFLWLIGTIHRLAGASRGGGWSGWPTGGSITSRSPRAGDWEPSGQRWLSMSGAPDAQKFDAVAASETGAVYVTGRMGYFNDREPSEGYTNALLAKFDAEGNRVWTEELGDTEVQRGNDVAVGESGAVYLAGKTRSALGQSGETVDTEDGFVAKFSASGDRQWDDLIQSSERNGAFGIAAADGGGVGVVGNVGESFGDPEVERGGPDGFVARYAADGTRRWLELLETGEIDYAYSIAADGRGHFVVVGTVGDQFQLQSYGGGRSDGFVAKYELNGEREWVRLVGGADLDALAGVATDADGHVVAVGSARDDVADESLHGGEYDILAAGFSPSGDQKWVRLIGSSGKEAARDVAEVTDQFYLAGFTDGDLDGRQLESERAFVYGLDTEGETGWTRTFGTDDGMTRARGIAGDPSGGLFVAGHTTGPFGGEPHGGDDDGFLAAW